MPVGKINVTFLTLLIPTLGKNIPDLVRNLLVIECRGFDGEMSGLLVERFSFAKQFAHDSARSAACSSGRFGRRASRSISVAGSRRQANDSAQLVQSRAASTRRLTVPDTAERNDPDRARKVAGFPIGERPDN